MRKGTVGAVLANAKILASQYTSAAEKSEAINAIKELVPILIALKMHEHVIWKNPDIQKIIDEAVMGNEE